MNLSFFTVLAWVFGILSLLLIVLRLIAAYLYTPVERALDRLHGREKSFSIFVPSLVTIVCWAWIFTN